MSVRADTVTPMEAAARALARLVQLGIVPEGKVPDLARAALVPAHRIVNAARTINAVGYRPPSDTVPVAIPAQPEEGRSGSTSRASQRPAPAPRDADLARQRRPATFPDGSTERRCPSCEQVVPIGSWRYVCKGRKRKGSAPTFAWRSWCDECETGKQRARYLSVARRKALRDHGLVLEGLATVCVICHTAIEPGEQAATLGNYHVGCSNRGNP